MRTLPTKDSENGKAVTAGDFFEAGRDSLALSLVTGIGHLGRVIEEPIANRPGLALSGFYEYFAEKRLQLVGYAEMAYLDSLADDVRRARFQALVDRGAFCFVYTNGQKPGAPEIDVANKSGAVLLTSQLETRVFVHDSAFVVERLSAPSATIYGTMVEVCGLGVLFEGDPGLGKSETALGLVKNGHALVADDLTCLRRETANNLIFGSASDATAGYMEIRGIGIMHVPSLFGVQAVRGEKRLDLVITFKRLEDVAEQIDRIGQTRQYRTILGVEIPNIIIPVSEGRDLVNLVETAALQQRLLQAGGNPVGELSARLRLRADHEALKSDILKTKGTK